MESHENTLSGRWAQSGLHGNRGRGGTPLPHDQWLSQDPFSTSAPSTGAIRRIGPRNETALPASIGFVLAPRKRLPYRPIPPNIMVPQ